MVLVVMVVVVKGIHIVHRYIHTHRQKEKRVNRWRRRSVVVWRVLLVSAITQGGTVAPFLL